MSDHAKEDIVQFLADTLGLQRMTDVFTPADHGAYDNRPFSVLVREVRGPQRPEVTEEVDYISMTITVSGEYGQKGEKLVAESGMRIYRLLRVLLDKEINGTLYLSITAETPPIPAGFDEYGRTVHEITVNAIRYLGGI